MSRIPRSGNGFVHCEDGQMRWGRFGAAGALFILRDGSDTEALLQLRSTRAHEGGTWSCPGGAIDEGESALEAALREATEEVGMPPEDWELLGDYTFTPCRDWTYVTSVIEVPRRFGSALNFESTDVGWFDAAQINRLELHRGFATAWPHLRVIAGF